MHVMNYEYTTRKLLPTTLTPQLRIDVSSLHFLNFLSL